MSCNNQILRKCLNTACYLGHLTCFLQSLRNKGESQPISRVLSRTIIHLQPVSPLPFSGLPESNASYIEGFLFGLAPDGVYQAASCYQSRGALLPHHFTLTQLLVSNQAVYFLLHWPWVRTPQVLPGTLLYGARTFLHLFPWITPSDKQRSTGSNCPADSSPA